MPAEDQARGQCDDHYRNVVALAGGYGLRSRATATVSTKRHAPKAALVSMIPTAPRSCDFNGRTAYASRLSLRGAAVSPGNSLGSAKVWCENGGSAALRAYDLA